MKRGFTLVELMIAVGVMAALATMGIINYFGVRGSKELDSATEIIVREINLTAAKAESQESGFEWWIHFDNPVGDGNDFYSICYGSYIGLGVDCSAEGGSESKRVNLKSSIEFTDPASGAAKNITFEKATGLPTAAATVTINSTTGAGAKTITANANGRIDF